MDDPHDDTHLSDWRDAAVDDRLVVRRVLDPDEAERARRRWTDVIGVVVAVDAGGLTLRHDPARRSDPRAGTEVHVPGEAVVAVRRLPPRPRRRGRPGPDGGPPADDPAGRGGPAAG